MSLIIKPYNSAPSQGRPAFSVRWASPILKKNGVADVAEFGYGRFRNVPILRRAFNSVDLIDLPEQIQRTRNLLKTSNSVRISNSTDFFRSHDKYDAIFLISVLHTVPSKIARKQILRNCSDKLRARGFLVIDVPQSETYYNRRKNTLRRYNDGWLLQHGSSFTFYKNFFAEELDTFVQKATASEIFERIFLCKHIIRIWRRKA